MYSFNVGGKLTLLTVGQLDRKIRHGWVLGHWSHSHLAMCKVGTENQTKLPTSATPPKAPEKEHQ